MAGRPHCNLALLKGTGADFVGLDEIARDPALVANLEPDRRAALSLRCAAVRGALDRADQEAVLPTATERALDAEEVGRLVGFSKSWVEHHAADLPPRRSIGGSPRWLLSEVTQWLNERPRYGMAT